MTKFKCIKETIGFTKGNVYEAGIHGIGTSDSGGFYTEFFFKEYSSYFQEVKECKFKVGDYAVDDDKDNGPIYIKISSSNYRKGEWVYNIEGSMYRFYRESSLRKPTKEELNKWFR